MKRTDPTDWFKQTNALHRSLSRDQSTDRFKSTPESIDSNIFVDEIALDEVAPIQSNLNLMCSSSSQCSNETKNHLFNSNQSNQIGQQTIEAHRNFAENDKAARIQKLDRSNDPLI